MTLHTGVLSLKEIMEHLEAELLAGARPEAVEVRLVCASDLMSDVLAFSKSRSLLLTGLTNPQVVRTAEMSEITAICFVRGKRPGPEAVEMARKTRIPLLSTRLSMYTACGRLYAAGLTSCDE